MNLLLDILS